MKRLKAFFLINFLKLILKMRCFVNFLKMDACAIAKIQFKNYYIFYSLLESCLCNVCVFLTSLMQIKLLTKRVQL